MTRSRTGFRPTRSSLTPAPPASAGGAVPREGARAEPFRAGPAAAAPERDALGARLGQSQPAIGPRQLADHGAGISGDPLRRDPGRPGGGGAFLAGAALRPGPGRPGLPDPGRAPAAQHQPPPD